MKGRMLGGGPHGEFVHVGLGQNDGPGLPQAGYGEGVVRGHEIFQYAGTRRGGRAPQSQGVLHRQRHAPQRFVVGGSVLRAFTVQGAGFGQGFGVAPGQQRAQARFGGVHAGQTSRGHGLGRDFARGQGGAGLSQGQMGEVAHCLPSTIRGTTK